MPQLSSELQNGVLVVTITNPEHGYMNSGTTTELLELLDRLEQDPEVRVVVFTGGIKGVFIQHYSVAELEGASSSLRANKVDVAEMPIAEHDLLQIARRLEALPKPVIGAMNGTAMGGGFEFAMAFDIRIAQHGEGHLYGLPEIHVGILPGAGGTQRLSRLVGVPRALEMILRGRPVPPGEALELGMVHEVVDDALTRANEIAAELAAKRPAALAHIKRLVRASAPGPDPALLEAESRAMFDLMLGDDTNDLMGAFNRGDLKLEVEER